MSETETPTLEIPLSPQELALKLLMESFPNAILGSKNSFGNTHIFVAKDSIVEVAKFLRDNAELQYAYFSECLGADYLTYKYERDFASRFEVIYNFMSLKTYSRLFLKIGVDLGETVPTLKEIYLGAEYPEREIQDLFGIPFEGNGPTPGMRFLLPDDWIGFPLRKDVGLGGEDVLFDGGDRGPAIEDLMVPHAGESFDGITGASDITTRP